MLLQNQQNFHNKDDKLLAKVTRDLERFKQPFFILIDTAQEKLHELEAKRKMVPKFDDYHHKLMDIECEILSKLITVYKKFADSYILDLGLFKWPKLSIAKNSGPRKPNARKCDSRKRDVNTTTKRCNM
jgi:hypothetical protein